jgi:hypothetical protein
MIASEMFGTQRTCTWTEEPRPLPKKRSTGPGLLRYPGEGELACSWWARMGKKIRQGIGPTARDPAIL